MMETSRGVIVACLLTLAALSSAFEELNSIDDIRRVYMERSLPVHSIILLHWFANSVDIDNNNVVRVPFDPTVEYGSHYYANFEGLLPPCLEGHQYCTVGNINPPSTSTCPVYREFPDYVTCPLVRESPHIWTNSDRIVFRVPRENSGVRTVGEMYVTEHYGPSNTFRITPNLLQQLRLFSFNGNSPSLQELRDQFDNTVEDAHINEIVNTWGRDQAPLGLLLFIILFEMPRMASDCNVHNRFGRSLETSADDLNSCEKQHIYLKVIAGSNGQAKFIWKNLPTDMVNNDVAPVLSYSDNHFRAFDKSSVIQNSEGSFESSEPLTEGVQVRLYKVRGSSYYPTLVFLKREICRGNTITSPRVPVTGYAQLQMFVRGGYACFRLYVKKSCDPWKWDFYNSWVGLYTSAAKDTTGYSEWRWAKSFTQGSDSGDYHTFEYCTGTTVAPGLQARFMIDKGYNEKARTPEWR